MDIKFDYLVGALTIAKESGAFNGMSFYLNKDGKYGFSKEKQDCSVTVEDWERYYKFDAAEEYENPSVFVVECILEEALNKLELEAEFEYMMNELEKKHY